MILSLVKTSGIDELFTTPNDDNLKFGRKIATIIDNGDKSLEPIDEDQEEIIIQTATGFAP